MLIINVSGCNECDSECSGAYEEKEIIYIGAKEQDGQLTFIVEDSGSVTKEALLHRTEQFMDDTRIRNGEAHYGMGYFLQKLWLKNMVEVLNFQILKIQVGRG